MATHADAHTPGCSVGVTVVMGDKDSQEKRGEEMALELITLPMVPQLIHQALHTDTNDSYL